MTSGFLVIGVLRKQTLAPVFTNVWPFSFDNALSSQHTWSTYLQLVGQAADLAFTAQFPYQVVHCHVKIYGCARIAALVYCARPCSRLRMHIAEQTLLCKSNTQLRGQALSLARTLDKRQRAYQRRLRKSKSFHKRRRGDLCAPIKRPPDYLHSCCERLITAWLTMSWPYFTNHPVQKHQ